MGKVLVTGASGFIGGQLTETLLARGGQVTCLVRRPSAAERLTSLGARFIVGDVTVSEQLSPAVANIDTVFHLAGALQAFNGAAFHRVNAVGVATSWMPVGHERLRRPW